MSLSPGDRLGSYEVLELLGAGGMGEVYKARDERLRRDVAVKVLPAQVVENASALERFQREARSTSALNHPGIVTVFEAGISEAGPYLAMELVEGRTLRRVLTGRAMPLKTALNLATQIAEALAVAHAQGIVHRDLKPENVMVTSEGRAKLLDFGLARLVSSPDGSTVSLHMDRTRPGTLVGTVGYMSPEQVEGLEVGPRSDQFSFGVVLYEMVTGKRAFRSRSPIDTLEAIRNESPEPVRSLRPDSPMALSWILDRCLAKSPEERYDSTRDLARDLARLRDQLAEAVDARPLEISGRLKLSPARVKRFVPALLAVALGLGLGFGFLFGRFVFPREAREPAIAQVTFRAGQVGTARFAPDGETILFGASRRGEAPEVRTILPPALEPRSLGLARATLAAVSRQAELAIRLVTVGSSAGILALAPLGGGSPREVLAGPIGADFGPDGKIVALLQDAGGTRRLELPPGRVLKDGLEGATTVRVSRDGALVAVDGPPGRVQVFDRSGLRKWVQEHSARGFAWGAERGEVVVALASGTGTEVRSFLVGGKERRLLGLPGQFHLQDVSPKGRLLLAREEAASEVRVLGPVPSDGTDLSWLDLSRPVDLGADGTRLLFTEAGAGGLGMGQVCVRGTDGGAVVRLGEGTALSFSPDGRWAVAKAPDSSASVRLLPTGPGEARSVPLGGIELRGAAELLPDGKRLLVSGGFPGRPERLHVLAIEGGPVRPVTPEGTSLPEGLHGISPDGVSVLARVEATGQWVVHRIEAGEKEPGRLLRGIAEGERPLQWAADGRSLFVLTPAGRVERLDVDSGRRTAWKELPVLPPGATLDVVLPSRDGRICIQAVTTTTSDLFVVDGAK